MNQQMDNSVEEYIEEGAISDSVMTKGSAAAAAAAKDRKKSLMTRLIPGRNAPIGRGRFFFLFLVFSNYISYYIFEL